MSLNISRNNLNLPDLLMAKTSDLCTELKKYAMVNKNKDFYYFYGDIEMYGIVLVAHIDTVYIKNIKLCQIKDTDTFMNYIDAPLGADDRVGVFICLLMHWYYNIPILLLNFEETGCQGAETFCKTIDKIDENIFNINKIKMFIEIDRRGDAHFVDYIGNPDEINDFFINEIGLRKETGTFSDILTLSRKTKVPSINLACGYYEQHMPQEKLVLSEMITTIRNIEKILEKSNLIPLLRVADKFEVNNFSFNNYYGFDNKYYKNFKHNKYNKKHNRMY